MDSCCFNTQVVEFDKRKERKDYYTSLSVEDFKYINIIIPLFGSRLSGSLRFWNSGNIETAVLDKSNFGWTTPVGLLVKYGTYKAILHFLSYRTRCCSCKILFHFAACKLSHKNGTHTNQ